MIHPRLELGEARISYVNAPAEGDRADRISRLTLELLREMMARELQHLGSDIIIDDLQVTPIEVSFETMTDEMIAQLSAEGIYHAILQVL